MTCLRRILHVRWQDKVPNTTILERCNETSIEEKLIRSQLRWCGHVSRMDNYRIPKQMLYGQLSGGLRTQGGQRKRYKDCLKSNLKACHMDHEHWEALAQDRDRWRRTCDTSLSVFEQERICQLKLKRQRRKEGALSADSRQQYTCPTCNRVCMFRIGLLSHSRRHR